MCIRDRYSSWYGGSPGASADPDVAGRVWGDYGSSSATVYATDGGEPVYAVYCGPAGEDPCPIAFGVEGSVSGKVGDATPVIATITSPWPAGTPNFQVTITGSGFGTNEPTLNISPSIPYTVSQPYADKQIIALVSVPAGDPTEPVNVSVTSTGYSQYGSGFYSGGGSESPTGAQASASTQAAPNVTPTIKMNGTTLSSLSNVPITIGQQIVLTATLPSPQNGIISSQGWGVPTGGTAILNFANKAGTGPADTTGGQVLPVTSTTTGTTTFYWVFTSTGSTPTVVFTYQLSNGNPQSATPVTFNVSGTPAVTASASGLAFGINPNQSEMAWGIIFNASNPSTTGLTWIQLVNSYSLTYNFGDGTSLACSLPPGFDAGPNLEYPYASGSTAEDSPTVALNYAQSDEVEAIGAIQLQMFLLWNPGSSNGSIPVPLGSLTWAANADVVFNTTTMTWSKKTGGAPSQPTFVPSSAYPTWGQSLTGTINIQQNCN